jgi:hypothetical protein
MAKDQNENFDGDDAPASDDAYDDGSERERDTYTREYIYGERERGRERERERGT